jgi:hypothetical protein
LNFPEDDYESSISNLHALITYLNNARIHEVWRVTTIEQNKEHFVVICNNANHLCTCMWLVTRGLVCRHFFSVMLNSDKAMFHIGLIPDRWYNEKFPNFQEEPAITICSEKNEPMHEHQIRPDFSLLHEIRHTQAFSETVKQNLSHRAKYNQGFGYAKKAIGLALEIGCEDELNEMLQRWIREKERSRIGKENLPEINNPYETRTKGAPRKRIKNALEGNRNPKSSGTASTHRSKYVCSHCKGSGHNARRCEHKKNSKKSK